MKSEYLRNLDSSRRGLRIHLSLGSPCEAGRFDIEMSARRFVESELITARSINTKLQKVCERLLDSLGVGGEQSLAFAQEIKILRDALSSVPMVGVDCPKCGSEITEEFTLTDVFIDNQQT